MGFDLTIVEWFQQLSNPTLDFFVRVITEFGDELIFLVIGATLYWCVNKTFAYRFMLVFLFSAIVNVVLKTIIARPRPYTLDTVDSIGPMTHGYAMPSGHAQNATAMAWVLQEKNGSQRRWVRPTLISMVVLVALSRVYLGQHYLTDVIAGIVVASLVYAFIAKGANKLNMNFAVLSFAVMPILVAMLFVVVDKNLTVAVATYIGITSGRYLELKYIDYNVKGTLKINAIKLTSGLISALILKEGLKMLFPEYLAFDFIRYMILAFWMTFGIMVFFNRYLKPPQPQHENEA